MTSHIQPPLAPRGEVFADGFSVDLLAVCFPVVAFAQPAHIERFVIIIMVSVDAPCVAAYLARLTG